MKNDPVRFSLPASRVGRDEAGRGRLLRRYAREHRPQDLEALVVSYRPLACSLARRYSSSPDQDADLEQAACEGLVKAIRRFDPGRGTSFTSFAIPTILGEVRRFIRDTAWAAHVPRKVQERVSTMRTVADRFAASTGRPPTVRELVAELGEPYDEVVEAISASRCFRTIPLDSSRGGDQLSVAERVGSEDPGFQRVEERADVAQALPRLAPEERLVLQLHFGDSMSQREIASQIGLSRSRVGRLLDSALERLRQGRAETKLAA